METVTSSLMTRRNDDEDDKEEEEKEKAFSAVRFARKSSRTSFCICLCATGDANEREGFDAAVWRDAGDGSRGG